MAFLSKAVFESRMEAMQAMMRREELEALAFTSGDFFQYASNYHLDVQTWERPVALFITRKGDLFALMNELSTHHLMMARERGSIWFEDVTLYDEHLEGPNAERLVINWQGVLGDLLKARGLTAGKIGTESPALFSGLKKSLPDLSFLGLRDELRRLRWVKHPEELDLMRAAADLSDWGQERYRENIRPGRHLQELDYAMMALMFEEGAKRFAGEHLELRGYTLSGPSSASPHGSGAPTGEKIEVGHGMVNIIIPRLNGCVIENERTYFCGEASEQQEALYAAALAANEAAIAEMVTGRPVCGIEEAARKEIVDAGFGAHIRHRTGHGIGILGHEFPDDMAFNARALESREVYSAEPGIYVYGLGGFRVDDTVVVGKEPEVLTKAPKAFADIVLPA